jgi:CIC family chloride channel protein
LKGVFYGESPFFPMTTASYEPSIPALLTYIFIAILTGLVAVATTKGLYLLEDLWEKTRIPSIFWPGIFPPKIKLIFSAISGLVVGVIGYFVPRTLGVGYYNISDIGSNVLPVTQIVIFAITKWISWIVALSSGTSGGTLAPLFSIGSGLGATLGIGFRAAKSPIDVTSCALLSMGGFFAGCSRAYLTTIAFIVESTWQVTGNYP